MSTNASATTLPGLPTELLLRIFSLLQVADLLSAQHTCRRFNDVVSDSASFQYVLHTELNQLEDLLPPDVSLHDRVALLKHHGIAWNNLQLKPFTRFAGGEVPSADCFILQEGYLIYKKVAAHTVRYGYTDLYSCSSPTAEARWSHFVCEDQPLLDIVPAVDHNLVVAISHERHIGFVSFTEFTTGAPHPLSLLDTVSFPVLSHAKLDVEIFKDYVLVNVVDKKFGWSTFFVISWKTGTITLLSKLLGLLRVVVIDPVNNLIALIKGATNSIEICELQFESAPPSLHTLCFLRLPNFKYTHPISFVSDMEWIPTSKPQDRVAGQTSRNQQFPFRPSRAGTIALFLTYKAHDGEVVQYSMFVSIGALLAAAHSNAHRIPWADWGPTGTRVVPLGKRIPTPAGLFWITNYAPFIVHDYDPLRARYVKKNKKSSSSSSNPSGPLPGPRSTKLLGEHWADGKIETCLPVRKLVAGGLSFRRVLQIVADREWVVVVSRTKRGNKVITIYHVGSTETAADRA